jgi:hypothetical protein
MTESVSSLKPTKLDFDFHRHSDILLLTAHLDFLERVQTAGSASWANGARFLPGPPIGQITVPEWPSAALDGAIFVNEAASGIWVEENTIAVGVLDEGLLSTDLAYKLLFKAVDIHLHSGRQAFDFRLIDPHVTGGTTAAIATL